VAHYILGNYGYIPPLVSSYNLDSACQVELSFDMNPIGFRTHTHDLGVLSTGYHIRGNEWNLIGQLSPQKPQVRIFFFCRFCQERKTNLSFGLFQKTFYEITNRNLTIRSNDILAARCTMNSLSRTSLTRIGPRNQDEMCNFYIMFYTSYMGRLDNIYCFRDAQKFHWPPRNQTN
jgi:peptidylglycine monooxygenase